MINDWGLMYNHTHAVSRSKQRINEKESFAVKLCSKCNYAYELVPNQYKQNKQAHYYEDFPKRGLYHQVCLKCQ